MDEELKGILKQRLNGQWLTVDITAHVEYFYNTLECDFSTSNPFLSPQHYPALNYP